MTDVSGKFSHSEGKDMTETEFLLAYNGREYPRPSVTVDLGIFTILDNDLKVLLITRDGHPFRGCLAFPGGFLDVKNGKAGEPQGENLEDAAHRELEEETGLPKGSCYLEQLYTFGDAGRDPRTRTVTVAYYALVRPTLAPMVVAGDDAASADWFSVGTLLTRIQTEDRVLAFDHAKILKEAVSRIQGKIDYAPLAFDLVPDTFTISELRAVYEVVKGQSYDRTTFIRKFNRMLEDGVIQHAEGFRMTGGRRAQVYRFNRPKT